MRRPAALVAAAATLVLGGCQAPVTGESREGAVPLAVKSGPVTFTAEPGPKLEGRFYAIVGGETSNDNRLYELGFSPPAIRLLTETARVSSVGACDGRVVVAAGQPEVGFSDHIQELRNRQLVPLDGLGSTAGFQPELDPECRVAYTWLDRATDALVGELRVWDPAQKVGRTLYRAQPGDAPLISPDWGPRGEVAAVRLDPKQAGPLPEGTPPGRPAAIIVVHPDGSVSEIDLGGDPGALAWGKKWMAVHEEEQGTIFVDPASGARSVLPRWRPVAWSPDGDQLLVKDAATRRILGLVDASDLSSVQEVGRVSGPVFDVDWLPA